MMLKVEPLSMRNLCSYFNGKRRKWKRSLSNTAHHNSDLKIANTFLSALRARNIINFQRRAMLSGHVGGALITFFYELIPSCRCRDDWWWGSKIGFLWKFIHCYVSVVLMKNVGSFVLFASERWNNEGFAGSRFHRNKAAAKNKTTDSKAIS